MEQPPRIRDHMRSEALKWREKAQIGDQVVKDCEVYGMSVWKRNEDGTVEPLDPASVTFTVVDQDPGGSESSISSAKMWQRPL